MSCLACLSDQSCGWCSSVSRCLLRNSADTCPEEDVDGKGEGWRHLLLAPQHCPLCEEYRDCSACTQVYQRKQSFLSCKNYFPWLMQSICFHAGPILRVADKLQQERRLPVQPKGSIRWIHTWSEGVPQSVQPVGWNCFTVEIPDSTWLRPFLRLSSFVC